MMPQNNDSFADTINRAANIPDSDQTGKGANIELPRLFGDFPIPPGEPIIANEKPAGAIENVPSYNFNAHLKRFVIGQVEVGWSRDGGPEYAEQDDSAAYEALLDELLLGKAVLRYEERKTLKDGTFVVSVCYLTPKLKKEPKTGNV